MITKADKGNCTVIIDKDKYEEKIFKLLNDKDTYILTKNDLTKSIERKLNKFIFDLYKIDRLSQKEYFYLRSTDAIAPRIYGLPKIHKPDWPLRPIVSFINSPLYNLSKFMAKILTPLINSNNLSIKNSFEWIDRISNFKINDNDLMLSFDVVSLFTKIPVHIAKSVIFDRLKCDSELKFRCKLNVNEIMNALDLCLNNTYLCFCKKFYRQIFGVAMGSPISVIVANLVMESIENKMLKDFASPPRIWLRYIDDTFVVLKKTEVVSFYKFINNIEESIKFTVEQEVDNAIPFLDVLIIRNNGQLTTKAYRKPTHTTRYLNFNSCHNFSQKVGLVKTLLFCANSKLITNYRDKINDINVYTYPYKTIGNILPKIKDSVDDIYKRGAIYKIPCKDCSNVYVGETGRCFNTRLSEHKRDLKPINLAKLKEDDLNKKTALVKHCFNCEHRIDFGNFEILDYNIDYDKRKFLESLYINNTKNSINDKDRNVFPKIYSNIKNLN